jgi:hypothetical protein
LILGQKTSAVDQANVAIEPAQDRNVFAAVFRQITQDFTNCDGLRWPIRIGLSEHARKHGNRDGESGPERTHSHILHNPQIHR